MIHHDAYLLCNFVHGFLSVSRTSIEWPAVLYIDQEMFGLGPVYLKDQICIFSKTWNNHPLVAWRMKDGAGELSEKSTMLSGGNSEKQHFQSESR